ncbi:MAG: hypothetical protein AAGJ35_06465, partial [Myxococcota bacterium]
CFLSLFFFRDHIVLVVGEQPNNIQKANNPVFLGYTISLETQQSGLGVTIFSPCIVLRGVLG